MQHILRLPNAALAVSLFAYIVPTSTTDSQGVCEKGWFGSNCRYTCRCSGNMCDTEGLCMPGYSCQTGWFGPSCQYYDLSRRANVTPSYLTVVTDSKDETCNDYRYVKQITLTWERPFPLQWLRLRVKNSDVVEKFQLQLKNNSKVVSCGFVYLSRIDSWTLDIHCDRTVLANVAVLTGDGVGDLCSLYISGGRNLALRQPTRQSSTHVDELSNIDFKKTRSDNAVDGDSSGYFDQRSCTHTKREARPSWFIALSSHKIVNRYVVFNREDSHRQRLKGFVLQAFTDNEHQPFRFVDHSESPRSIYEIVDSNIDRPVSEVNIFLTRPEVLTLCEVELYGDSTCASGRYGRDCEHSCNCAIRSEACFVSTGGCPSGCPSGFHGEGCRQGEVEFSHKLLEIGLGVGLTMLVISVGVGIACAWRLGHSKRDRTGAIMQTTTRQARPRLHHIKSYTYNKTDDEGYEIPEYVTPIP